MTDIQSKEVIDKISDELKIQPALVIPRAISKDIQLVYNVNPKRTINIVKKASSSTTGTTTIFTTPSDRDFFLTGFAMSVSCNVTADSTRYFVSATPFGIANVSIGEIEKQSVTALSHLHVSKQYNFPMLIERSSAIVLSQTFTVGASFMVVNLEGFTTDPQ